MITWELKLSSNQIATLKMIRSWERSLRTLKKGGDPTDAYLTADQEYRLVRPHGSHIFVTGANRLLKEGLVTHESSGPNAGWHMTERGEMILQMIEEDLVRFANESNAVPTKKVKAKKAS